MAHIEVCEPCKNLLEGLTSRQGQNRGANGQATDSGSELNDTEKTAARRSGQPFDGQAHSGVTMLSAWL